MKKILGLLVALILVAGCMVLLPTQTEAASVSTLRFTLNEDGESYSVTDCYEYISGSLVIPAIYNGKPVVGIGEEAFSGRTSLTSVTIPDSVITIDDSAFYYCTGLTSVSIGNGVTIIGDSAFNYCTSLTSVSIGNSVTSIGEAAFYQCTSLTSVTIPDSVTSVGDHAFQHCYDLTSVIIGSSVTSIGEAAFYQCTSLISVSIGNSVNSIGDYAFSGCGLTSLDLPNSVTSIGGDAFSGCDMISLIIPDSVTSIGGDAFRGCDSLMSVIIGNGVSSVGRFAFYGCDSLVSVRIGDGVISIGEYAFNYCTNLSSVSMGSKVTDVGYVAFGSCTSLQNVYFAGTEAQWYAINIGRDNEKLAFASITFNAKFADIAKQPANAVAQNGKTVKATVSATGDGLTYQWYYKNAGSANWSKSAYKSKTYSTTMTAAVNDRQLYCVITDQYGNEVTTDVVTLYMGNPLKITTQPKTTYTKRGETTKIGVEAEGDGLTYQWYFKSATAKSFAKSSNKTATYSTTMTEARNGYKVYCVITDKYGNTVTTNTVTLKMQQTATITKQPTSVTVANGKTAKVTVSATGDGLIYQWYYKSATGSKYFKSSNKTATYSTTMNEARNGYKVYCVITDKYGNTVTTNTVTLKMQQTATITKQPTSVTVANGKTAKVTVSATGDGLTYQWYYKSATGSKYFKSSNKTATYSTTMNEARNGYKVYCVITDKYGNTVTTNTVTLKMQQTATITKQPASVTVAEGATAKVTVSATGDGLTYQWYYKSATSSQYFKSSNKTATYSTTMNEARNGYKVYCVITDTYGNVVKTNVVTLKMK